MPLNLVERLRCMLPLTAVGIGCGAAAVSLNTLHVEAEPRLWDDSFHLVRSADDPFVLTSDKRLSIERQLGDFDLVTTVELPVGGELDLLVHLVQPKLDTGDGTLFHARYDSLRVSTVRTGPAFATREQVLFERDSIGGVEVAPGIPATIHVKARGHRVRATIAGKATPWFESADSRGSIVFVLRGDGPALIRYLDLQPLARSEPARPWAWSMFAAGVLGMLLGAFRVRLRRGVGVLAAIPVAAAGGGALVLSQLSPGAAPTLLGLLAFALSGLPLTIALSLRVGWRGISVATLLVVFVWELGTRIEQRRLQPFEDPRLSAVLGPDSGAVAYDILSPQLRSSSAVHKPFDSARRIVFLGGAASFDAGGRQAPQENLGLILAAQIGEDVDGVVVPTMFSSAAQQLAMFERFLVDEFAPAVVVFAVTSDESEPLTNAAPFAVLDRGAPAIGPSALLTAQLARFAAAVAPGSVADLRRVFDRLARLSEEHSFRVAIYTPEALDPAFETVVASQVRAAGWPRLTPRAGDSTLDNATRFAESLRRLFPD